MTYKIIDSSSNKTYKKYLSLRKGDNENSLFLVEGIDLVKEAFKRNCLVELLTYKDDENLSMFNVPVTILKQGLFRELATFKSLPVVIGVCRKALSNINEAGDSVIYLDCVQDPGNVGTIIRSALSFSYSSIIFSSDSVSPYNSKLIQSSKGAFFHLPIIKSDLYIFKEKGYNIYATTLDGEDEKKYASLSSPFVLVFGNEGRGVRKEYQDISTKLKIEMSNIDSLNVAVCASIFMYRFQKGNNK